VKAGVEAIHPSAVVRNLGILFDLELSLKQHVAKEAATCFYRLRRLSQTDIRLHV
jgi:hypothetical protein